MWVEDCTAAAATEDELVIAADADSAVARIEEDHVRAVDTGNGDCCLVQWTAVPYAVPDTMVLADFNPPVNEGELVADSFFNPISLSCSRYAAAPGLKVAVPVGIVPHQDIVAHSFAPEPARDRLPRRNKLGEQLKDKAAVRIDHEDDSRTMDELRRRDQFAGQLSPTRVALCTPCSSPPSLTMVLSLTRLQFGRTSFPPSERPHPRRPVVPTRAPGAYPFKPILACSWPRPAP